MAVDPGSTAVQRFGGSGTLTVEGSVAAPGAVLRNPAATSTARLVVATGRLVVGSVDYDATAPVPPHPFVTVTAPTGVPPADGPPRLVPSTG